MNITRHNPLELHRDMSDFVEPSPNHGDVIAVYSIETKESKYGTVYISEYEDGKFWTIVGREDCIGTLSDVLKFLNDNL